MDYYENRNSLSEWIDCKIYGLNYCLEKVKLKSLISEVLERLPSEDRETLMYKRCVHFIALITKNSIAEQIFIDPISVKNEQKTLCRCTKCNELHFTPKNGTYDLMVGIWLICLSSDILTKSREEALYTIALELAHVYLELPKTADGIEEFAEHDAEAEKQVIKWCFESELRKIKNYFSNKKKYIENGSFLQMQ